MNRKNIIGIIPAAGKGTRLAPFPCAKELFPVGYQNFLVNGEYQKRPKVVSQYLIENIVAAGADKMIVIIGEGKSDIMKYYGSGNNFGADFSYLYQSEQKGMPFAINLAENWVQNSTVIFGMPDTIIEPADAFQKLLEDHQKNSADLTLGLFATQTPSKFGMVQLDKENYVVNTIDKPASSDLQYMWGCACWSPVFTKLIADYIQYDDEKKRTKEMVLGEIFNEAISKKLKVKGYCFEGGQYIDIGTADELDQALKKFHL